MGRLYAFLAFLLILVPSTLHADAALQPAEALSAEAEISLITGDPGKSLYTRFGHSAIRVHDPEKGIDLVYNYGTFNFKEPGFYTNFLKGKLRYFLSRYEFRRMLIEYQYFNQTLYEQVLNLNHQEKLEVFEFLNRNYLPENRYYLYDFFYDNCSSRIRDVFKLILGEKLEYRDDFIGEHKTLRQLLDIYIEDQAPWGDFGIDLVLGTPADKTATSMDYMFLPYEMYRAFEHAVILENGEEIPFVKKSHLLYEAKPEASETRWFTPENFFWALFLLFLVITVIGIRRQKYYAWIDALLFLALFLAGMVIFLLWFATDHIATKTNYNLLWASPVHLLSLFLLLTKRYHKFSGYYFLFWSIFTTLIMVGWYYIPQQLNPDFIPLLLIIVVRSYRIYLKKR